MQAAEYIGYKMKTDDLFKHNLPTLEQLYNTQKARVYEFILRTNLIRTRAGGTPHPNSVTDSWYNETSNEWIGNFGNTKEGHVYRRVYKAKSQYENAGGKYPFIPHDVGPRGEK